MLITSIFSFSINVFKRILPGIFFRKWSCITKGHGYLPLAAAVTSVFEAIQAMSLTLRHWLLSHITIVETMNTGERGLNPVAMTIINPRKVYWPSRRLEPATSCAQVVLSWIRLEFWCLIKGLKRHRLRKFTSKQARIPRINM